MKSPTGPEPVASTWLPLRRSFNVIGLMLPNGELTAPANAANEGLRAPVLDSSPKSSRGESVNLYETAAATNGARASVRSVSDRFRAWICGVTQPCSCSTRSRGQQLVQPNSSSHNGFVSPAASCASRIERSEPSVSV
jgi:hypothetical protein